ncbi:hypothetical protein ACHAXT_005776 [Thalassiosira profunda]
MPCGTRRQRALLAAALVLALGSAVRHHQLASAFFPGAVHASDLAGAPNNATTAAHEPLVDRWRRRFASRSGFLFFKHLRKAGGTALRKPLFEALSYHGHGTLLQFLNRTGEDEARRHFPFLNEMQRRVADRFYRWQTNNSLAVVEQRRVAERFYRWQTNNTLAAVDHAKQNRVYYIEQEFGSMDWRCRDVDPRWNASLSVIVLRHPIERHLSEYLYSGPPSNANFDGIQYGKRGGNYSDGRAKFIMDRWHPFQINRTKLHANRTYTEALAAFLEEHLQTWMRQPKPRIERSLPWYFHQRYVDNFQLRAMAGCSSAECLTNDTAQWNRNEIIEGRRSVPNSTNFAIDSVCTMHPFYGNSKGKHVAMVDGGIPLTSGDHCYKNAAVCPNSCDGPCFYPAAPWGPLNDEDLLRARHALEGFDVILLTETLDDDDQRAMLADALGVPRKVMMGRPEEGRGNVRVQKRGDREKTHYYRDLMANLTRPQRVVQSMIEENRLEIEFYEHAVRLNTIMTERWKREVDWKDGP